MNYQTISSFSIVGILFVSLAARADEPSVPVKSEQIQELIANLSSDQFNKRQKAFETLDGMPDASATHVINAYFTGNQTAEVHSRCLALLKKWCERGDEKLIGQLEKAVAAIEAKKDPARQLDLNRLREILLLDPPTDEKLAIEKLKSLGCKVESRGKMMRYSFEDWKGSVRQLQYLRALKEPFEIQVNEINLSLVIPALQGTNVGRLAVQSRPVKFRHMPVVRANVRTEDLRSLPSCKKLTSLSFSMASVEDKCLEIIGKCSSLTDLQLPDTTTDDVLKHLAGLTKLRALVFHNAFKVHGDGLVHFHEMKDLETLEIYFTNVSTKSLKHIARLPKLRNLYVPQTSMYDDGMKYVAQMSQLERLQLDNTHVTNRGLMELMKLKKLNYIYLGSGSFSDAGLLQLAKLKSLREVHAGGSIITKQGKEALANANPAINVNGTFFEPKSINEYAVIEELLAGGMRVEQYPRTSNFTMTFEESQWKRPIEDIQKLKELTNPRLILVGPLSEPVVASIMKLPTTTRVMAMNGRGNMAQFHKEHIERLKERFTSFSDNTNR